MGEYEHEGADVNIADALRALPLCDELYLGMQAFNLGLVDAYLGELERDLLAEYIEIERTPTFSATFVSALSQMWIFALYELLRTWRQRAKSIISWAVEYQDTPNEQRPALLAAKKAEIEQRSAEPAEATTFYWPAFEAVAADAEFATTLRSALDKSERLFRRIEALRVNLAKHEIPRERGAAAMAPGYGRIDMASGSIYWQVTLGNDEIDLVSRRAIADDCRSLALDRDSLLLTQAVQEEVARFPRHSYGIKRVGVVLDDGSTYGGVYVAWCKEVVQVEGYAAVPFDARRVVEVQSDPLPPPQDPAPGHEIL